MSAPSYGIKNLDHHGLVSGFCQELGIAAIIDKALPAQSEQKHISFGQLLCTKYKASSCVARHVKQKQNRC